MVHLERVQRPQGRVKPFRVYPGGSTHVADLRAPEGFQRLPGVWAWAGDYAANLVMFDQAVVAAQLLTGHPEFRVAAMYFEFQNVADADDPVTAPTYDRSGGLTYYDALASSGDTDYLRVPIIASTVTSTDADKFPLGNLATFYGQTAGTVGVHGKQFSDLVNSKVFGAALVATPNFNDATQDLIVSRFYFATNRQQVKLPSSQIAVAWPLLHD